MNGVLITSNLWDQGSFWELVILFNGPHAELHDHDRTCYNTKYIKLAYHVNKKPEFSKALMENYLSAIHGHYTVLRDHHPDKFRRLLRYGFSHAQCDTENGIWHSEDIYWSSRDMGRVDRLFVRKHFIGITLRIDYEDIDEMEWEVLLSTSNSETMSDDSDDPISSSHSSSSSFIDYPTEDNSTCPSNLSAA